MPKSDQFRGKCNHFRDAIAQFHSCKLLMQKTGTPVEEISSWLQ